MAIEWRSEAPDESGIWWYRPPTGDGQFQPVEFDARVRDRPFVIYYTTPRPTYRHLDDPYFEGREWHGPVARRGKDGGWDLVGLDPTP